MSWNNGTNLSTYFQQKFQSNTVVNNYNMIQTVGTLRGNLDTEGQFLKKNDNQIICGNSLCGSKAEPTWQFCLK